MIWVWFLVSSALIVVSAILLAKYGDAIALRTGLGGMFIGTVLLATATSLPELITSISAIRQNIPDLAIGNLFGSNMVNMLVLAILDLIHHRQRILRKAALKHSLSGSLTVFLIGLVVFFIVSNIKIQVGWIGLDSITIIVVYLVAIRLIQKNAQTIILPAKKLEIPQGTPGLAVSLIGFGAASTILLFATPWMVQNSKAIAEITGLGTTFIGTTLVALVTSLPELVTTISAARLGADDMAISNLFGSNLFNMAAIGITDFFYLKGRILGVVDPAFLLVALLGLLMTGMGLIGNLARIERRLFFIEVDALLIILVYFGGLWLLYLRGIAA
jgi:cation:H+ antiporter